MPVEPGRTVRIGVIAGSVIPFLPSLGHGFAYDDIHTVWGHPGVRGPFAPREILLRDWWGEPLGSPGSLGSYRPVATLSLWLDRALGGGSPVSFHLTNLLLYVALLSIAYRFLAGWLEELPRLIAIAMFATMAIHVEVVANATGRAELLAALFSLGALHFAIAGRIAPFALLLLLAVFSKESAYPMALLAPYLAYRFQRPMRRVLVASLAVLAVAVLVRARYLQFRRVDPQMAIDNPLVFAGFGRRIAGAMDVLGRYFGHAASGAELCPDYGYAHFIPGAFPWLGVAIAIALIAALLRSFRRKPRVADALIAFAASYAVVSHVIVPASILLAERVFFFPSLWLIVALVGALQHVRIVGIAGVAFAAMQALFAWLYLPAWKNDQALAAHTVRTCPLVLRGRMMAMEAAGRRGDAGEAAWAALTASAIWQQRPSPIAEDFFPDEDAPLPERVATLRTRLGPQWPATIAGARVLLGTHAPAVARLNDWNAR